MTDQPSSPPPPPPYTPPPPPPAGAPKQQNAVMIVLAYLWILALVPLLVEKEDREVQWHAKHGIVLLALEIVVWILIAILTSLPVLGVVGCAIYPLVWVVFLVIHVLAIVKGLKGERFIIPGISQYADRF
jgi:uncharacterized membrane protein